MIIPQLPPFRLYGLVGCPHCVEAESYLHEKGLPAILVVANDDPIAQAGVKALTGEDAYPILCCTIDKTIVKGFKRDEFDRLAELYRTTFGGGLHNGVGGQLQPNGPDSPQAAEVLKGAD
jgi:glutaredoxin